MDEVAALAKGAKAKELRVAAQYCLVLGWPVNST